MCLVQRGKHSAALSLQQSKGWRPGATGKKKKKREKGRERVGLVLR